MKESPSMRNENIVLYLPALTQSWAMNSSSLSAEWCSNPVSVHSAVLLILGTHKGESEASQKIVPSLRLYRLEYITLNIILIVFANQQNL